ncbi:glycoside-pentoside-hexuronide (GPH):cation symporter [Enterobacter hormaechei]|uniref:glycoside-pentoside-hexuronide (GPH):cation symporter n=1 Tax=Enterobacter hormaechei TaxID=158836 RepID=UPI00209B9200|nr:glycoside-pentoside-hexuronide (GPH):cation symporter [Enterobacter hormaechei]MCO7444020.1 glycoside-pentoside-hexuronide (GPH):cation symporter [Enterobacter hormaechei]
MTQLTMKDKIGYGLGDTACGFVWQATMFLLAYFYTDVFGLSAGIMGTLFLVSRVLDAVTDPLMGLLVDRTRTRYGQFRPFLLWGAIPFGIVCMLTFYTPDFSAQGKIIYACATYILLTLVYTFVNVPYCAMPGVITADPKERHALQSWRFFLAAAGSLAISGIALPLVSIIGKGNEQVGYFGAMCVLGLTGVVLLYVCFFTTKERYTFEVQPGSSVAKDLKLLLGNGQWRIMCAFKMMATCSNVVRGGAVVGWILAWVNYSASSSVQPVEVLTTIKILFCVVPVVLYAGMFIMLSFYKLTDARVEAISQQLIKHRATQGEAVPDAATAASH